MSEFPPIQTRKQSTQKQNVHPQRNGASGKAITSLILGLLSLFCMLLTGIPAIIFGVLGLNDIKKSGGSIGGMPLAIVGIVTGALGCLWTVVFVLLLIPAIQQVNVAAVRAVTNNNMQQMAIAALNYESAFQRFPSCSPDPERPERSSQLSWRVQLLPFLEESKLHDEFHHDEPWDSPHNLALVERMPEIYKSPGHELPPGKTMFVVATTPMEENGMPQYDALTVFVPGQRSGFGHITDGTSNTVLFMQVDSDAAVTWTQPTDWELDPSNPKRSVGGAQQGKILTVFVDGSLHTFRADIPPEKFKALLTRSDGEIIDYQQYEVR